MKKVFSKNNSKNTIIGSLILISVACFLHTNLSDTSVNQNAVIHTEIQASKSKDSRIPDLSFAKQVVYLFTRFVTAK